MSDRSLVPLGTIKSMPQQWLWQGYLPLGAVTIFDGDPGSAKSLISYDIAARVTTGKSMPDGSAGVPPACVILLQAEDDVASTVVPRLVAAGGEIGRVLAYDPSRFLHEPLRLPDDLYILESQVADLGVKLVVADPLSSFLSTTSTSDVRVRQYMGPLADFARRTGAAVVCVRHFNKSDSGKAIHRGLGGIGVIAAARSALAVVDDPTSTEKYRHVLVQTKSNLASTAPSILYRTVNNGGVLTVEWLGPSDRTADELVGNAHSERSALDEAIWVLYSILEQGPVAACKVFGIAGQAGVAKRTLDRAKKELRVKPQKHGSGKGSFWTWQLPDDDFGLLAELRQRDIDELMNKLVHGDDFASDTTDTDSVRDSQAEYRGDDADEGGIGAPQE